MENNQYLGTEKVGKLLGRFAIPCIFSLIISCLYNIVDQIFVGNGIGYLGNAATGVIFPITVVGWGMSLFFGDGAAAHLSVALGRNETESIHRGVGNAALCSFLSDIYLRTEGMRHLPAVHRPCQGGGAVVCTQGCIPDRVLLDRAHIPGGHRHFLGGSRGGRSCNCHHGGGYARALETA